MKILTEISKEIRRFNEQLEQLNTNLEALAVLMEKYQKVPVILADLRQIAADTLGWKVL